MEALHKRVADLLETYRIRKLSFDERRAFVDDVTSANGNEANLSANTRQIIMEAEQEREMMAKADEKLAADRAALSAVKPAPLHK